MQLNITSLIFLPTPWTLFTNKLQLFSALFLSSSYDKSIHCNKIQGNHNSSLESNIRILKGMNYRKKCAILFLFLGVYLFPKLTFLILQVQCMYLLFNLVKTTKCIFLPLWWRAELILDITSHADHHYFSLLSFKIIFIMGPVRDPLFSFPALLFFFKCKKGRRGSRQKHPLTRIIT